MRQSIKSYLVFTSFGYRLILYLGIPLLFIGAELFMLEILEISGIMTLLCMLTFLEIMSDTWFLGGIQEKNAEKMDYLKTSPRGMSVIKSALVTDLIRRFVTAAGIFAICGLLEAGSGKRQISAAADLVMPVFAVYSLSVAAILITRFFSYFQINMLAGYIVSIAGAVCYLLQSAGMVSAETFIAVYAVLGMAVSILAVWIALKKVEGGYYDK